MKQILLLVFLVGLGVAGYGQELWRKQSARFQPSVCYASKEVHKSFVRPPLRVKGASTKTAVIVVDYVGFPDDVKAAFQYAVDIWAELIYSPVPIHVQATWKSLEEGVLGSCAPTEYFINFNSTQKWDCYYPIALAEKMMGKEMNTSSEYEVEANFNKDYENWYFGTDGDTPTDKYDFVSTVLHELCHGFGFHGYDWAIPGLGGYGEKDDRATVFDEHVHNKKGEQLVDTDIFPNPSNKLFENYTSGWLEFVSKLNEGDIPRLYAPEFWSPGSSVYHLDDDIYPYGNDNSLMTHAMGMGEANFNPGPKTLAIMNDMGWKSVLIKHEQIKDVEVITSPVNFEAQIESDFDLDLSSLFLMYSTNNFQTVESVQLKPTSTANVYNAQITPSQNSTVQYYFSASDVESRNFVYPSNSPERSLSFKVGTDKTAPTISHDPINYMLSNNLSVKIEATVTDNMGIKSVKVEYLVNSGSTKELTLTNDEGDHYTGILSFTEGSVNGGDVVSYKIIATDKASQSNVANSPASGYHTFKIESIQNPVDKYVADFNGANQDFIGSDFTIKTPSGFDNAGLNSDHPYQSPDTDNVNYNFSTILRYPIVLKANGKMTFDEVVLVEPGETDSEYGDSNFWDYVIVEGSTDGGTTWKPLCDGYDSNSQESWLDLWESSTSDNNSTAVPTKSEYVKHEINMLANGNFKEGDTVLIRFRLFSDSYAHGWGWIIDNLAIQDIGTAINPELISSGEVRFYPNPVSDQLSIQVDAKNNIHDMQVKAYNTSGVMVYNQVFAVESNVFQTTIDMGNFTSGLYLFAVITDKGQVISRKVIVQ